MARSILDRRNIQTILRERKEAEERALERNRRDPGKPPTKRRLGRVPRPKEVEAYLARKARAKAGAPETDDDRKLVHRDDYGALRVYKDRPLRTGLYRAYRCRCRCGGEVRLIAKDILRRQREGIGCLGLGCEYSPPWLKVWHNPRYALWAQLTELVAKQAEIVGNELGGCLYEGLPPTPIDEAVANLLPQVKGSAWWLRRADPKLPWTDYNLAWAEEPDREEIFAGGFAVRYGDATLTLKELAKLFRVSLQELIDLRLEVGSDEALIDAAIHLPSNR